MRWMFLDCDYQKSGFSSPAPNTSIAYTALVSKAMAVTLTARLYKLRLNMRVRIFIGECRICGNED